MSDAQMQLVEQEAPRDHMAEAYDDALLCVITRQDFLGILRAHPDMAFRVTKLVGFRLKTQRNRVEGLLFKGAPARLAQTLLDLALADFRSRGLVEQDGRHLRIVRLEELRALARTCAPSVSRPPPAAGAGRRRRPRRG